MRKATWSLAIATLIIVSTALPGAVTTNSRPSTRVTGLKQHVRSGEARYPYRAKSEYILRELDLKPGDVVVDVGAGDGWWARRMVEFLGDDGIIHAGEVEETKVKNMKKNLADVPQIKPYLCPTDSTGLAENSCDLAFFSQTYHHLDPNGRADYLRRLRRVVKPTGRVCIIEKYTMITTRQKSHGTPLSELIAQAEQAGWILVRCELMTTTNHYLATFVQKDLFASE